MSAVDGDPAVVEDPRRPLLDLVVGGREDRFEEPGGVLFVGGRGEGEACCIQFAVAGVDLIETGIELVQEAADVL